MKRFTQDILNIKRGDADVDKVYKGAVQIFPEVAPVLEDFAFIYYQSGSTQKVVKLSNNLTSSELIYERESNLQIREFDYNKNVDKLILASGRNPGKVELIDVAEKSLVFEQNGAYRIDTICFNKDGDKIVTGSLNNLSSQVSLHSIGASSFSLIWSRAGGNATRAVFYDEINDYVGYQGFSGLGLYDLEGNSIWRKTGAEGTGFGNNAFSASIGENTLLFADNTSTQDKILNYLTGVTLFASGSDLGGGSRMSYSCTLSNGDFVFGNNVSADLIRISPIPEGTGTPTTTTVNFIWTEQITQETLNNFAVHRIDCDENDNIYVSYRNTSVVEDYFVALFDSNGVKINEIQITDSDGRVHIVAGNRFSFTRAYV
jgi:hypothetical protein